jgi:hypothetical protein
VSSPSGLFASLACVVRPRLDAFANAASSLSLCQVELARGCTGTTNSRGRWFGPFGPLLVTTLRPSLTM